MTQGPGAKGGGPFPGLPLRLPPSIFSMMPHSHSPPAGVAGGGAAAGVYGASSIDVGGAAVAGIGSGPMTPGSQLPVR